MSKRKRQRTDARHRAQRELRDGSDRRSARERRRSADIHDLYQTDLDRHLWAFTKGRARKGGKRRKSVKRRVARLVAGALGVAGLTYYFYRRFRDDEGSAGDDALSAQAEDAVEAEDQEEEPAGV